MPLSEHEQRMLDQIESALYAEDPKFASHVRSGRMRTASSKRRFQAAALFVLGLVLLIAGLALPVKPGGFPVISLVGFVFMFGAGVLFLLGGSRKGAPAAQEGASGEGSSGRSSGAGGSGQKPKSGRKGGGFTSRMEDRFRRRFEQE
ncbi:DUF3040 domain-containing protein [Rhodococcus sp. BP-252]|uniref:DUF3040 domain-containing protein n=1 Tax=Rhodococcoides kyotonense TaxID=398843 RepID=A0A177YPG1_9NOCA|nr:MULTISPECIES: DUF3040 domain-containing protein [Rhodococcus]NIL74486.1 hypothetical protein [Rhodococcus sp. B10]MBY6411361.1 DUF3040 domain-containing protein [Rhodococcus sp. BP-320]MBY6416020.1 DUF3040 domain-containing protein [Rhodococcus sp. BP-321]MBY6420471.1 DUF3040 domain-containing protein [Rhodococcus sp. BP-324]MBY6426227.1 DUF3040 domain-containing protein [Rhodococcus sp. BP-323]